MPRALLLVADGSEEIEFVTPYDVLIRAGCEVASVGVCLENGGFARMSRNIRIIPDYPTLASISTPQQTPAHEHYDILILPGGAAGAQTFCSYAPVLDLIRRFRDAGKWVAAICAASTVLVAASTWTCSSSSAEEDDTNQNQSNNKKTKIKITSHPTVKHSIVTTQQQHVDEWDYSEERIVIDDNARIITSRGPGTAMLFALTIVEVLCGVGKRSEVAAPMVVAECL